MDYFLAKVTLTRPFGEGIRLPIEYRLVRADDVQAARMAVYKHYQARYQDRVEIDIEIEDTIV